uniref:FK506-binding protein n=1 Tax=Lutzomyia longipalpis TaxID=7200 RepID=A0A1B0CAA1_LUTLO
MVFGLVLTPNKKYSQTVEKDYQLSNAALDTRTCGQGDTQLMVTVEKNTYLLCTLNKEHPQCTLDLQVSEGEKIGFCSMGTGTIHLVGYMLPDDPMGDDFEGDEESDASEEEDEDTEVPQLVPIEGKKGKNVKKEKPASPAQEDSDDDEEDDDDDDDAEDDDQDDDSEGGEEEEDDDDDEEEEDDDSDEEPQPQKKAKLDVKQNGLENGTAQPKSKKELKKQKKQEAQQKKDKPEGQQKQQQQQQKGGKKQVLQGGVVIEDLKVGDGPEAKSKQKVSVFYEGRLKSNNKVFDSCKSGNGFKFTIGRGEVIRGWEVGVAGMKVGSKRRITCPPQMAYGAKGSPPVIPPNSTLVFDVELRQVKN